MFIGGKDDNSRQRTGQMTWKNNVIFIMNICKMLQLGRNNQL